MCLDLTAAPEHSPGQDQDEDADDRRADEDQNQELGAKVHGRDSTDGSSLLDYPKVVGQGAIGSTQHARERPRRPPQSPPPTVTLVRCVLARLECRLKGALRKTRGALHFSEAPYTHCNFDRASRTASSTDRPCAAGAYSGRPRVRHRGVRPSSSSPSSFLSSSRSCSASSSSRSSSTGLWRSSSPPRTPRLIAAEIGDTPGSAGNLAVADCAILQEVERDLTPPAQREQIQTVDITWSDELGSLDGRWDRHDDEIHADRIIQLRLS